MDVEPDELGTIPPGGIPALDRQWFLRLHALNQLFHRNCRRRLDAGCARARGCRGYRGCRVCHRYVGVRRQELLWIVQLGQRLTCIDRGDDFRRYDDDKFGIRFVPLNRLKEFAQNWNASNKRNLREGLGFAVVEQTADSKALLLVQFDFCLHSSNSNRRFCET